MQESYASLLEAFDALNRRKREDPDSLNGEERERWKQLRREIEAALFDHSVEPERDTREHLRVPVALSVRFRSQDELKDRYIPVLGEGGLFVSSVDPLPTGSVLDLELLLAHRALSFHVAGVVVYSSDAADPACRGMGVRFLGLTYEQKRMIYGLVDDSLRERLLERRRHARVDARLDVQFLFADGFFEEATDNLSMGGLFIAGEHLLPVGERLRLVLHVPGERPAVKAVAEVANLRERASQGKPRGMGVRFVELAPEDRETLRVFLARALDLEVPLDGVPTRMAGGDDRRLHPRMEHRIQLRYHWLHSFGVCCASDISTGGLFLQSSEPTPPPGSPIEVTLTHPVTLQTLVVGGSVVRAVPADPARPGSLPGAAVAFEPLGPAREALLRSILEYYVQVDGHGGGGGSGG